MSDISIPIGYRPLLDRYQTQKAIGLIKRIFEDNLCAGLNLLRVSAPLFVDAGTGLNDDLNGVERPVSFDVPAVPQAKATVVHSLAKWKRMALKRYEIRPGKGLVTDMNAIRRDETLDNLHSIYVDQWDWEKIITPEQRTPEYLKQTVQTIVDCICSTQLTLDAMFPALSGRPICREVTFISAQELEDRYPDLTPKQREDEITRLHHTVFLSGIGAPLRSGIPHDGRAPDYDDWTLNGDILLWHEPLQCSLEVSSMGIRVDPPALDRQLTAAGCDDRRQLPYHRALLAGQLPLTIGGGIGQSRLCMLLMGNVHIGEVQASLWDEATVSACEAAGIPLL